MPKMYFCTECNKEHRCGSIYQRHLRFKKVEEQEYNETEIKEANFPLRAIARRQIDRYKKKIEQNPDPFWKANYIREINKVIEYESKRTDGN